MSNRSLCLMDVDDEEDIIAEKTKQIKFKQKLIVPKETWLEKKTCEKLLSARFDLLKEGRISKNDAISEGEWLDGASLVRVSRKRGSFWSHMGHTRDKDTFLYPEEAIFLMEINCLIVKHHEVPVSIQQAFTLFLSKSQINLRDYRLYAQLNRLGLKVMRYKFQRFSQRLGVSVNRDMDINDTNVIDENLSDDLNLNDISSSVEDRNATTDTNKATILKKDYSSTIIIDISSETTDTSVEALSPEKAVIVDENVNTDLVAEVIEVALDAANPVVDITSEEDVVNEQTGATKTLVSRQGRKKRKSLYNPFSNQRKIMKPNDEKQSNSPFDLIPDSVGKNEVIVIPPKSYLLPKNITFPKQEYKVILKRQSERINRNSIQHQTPQINRNKIKRRKKYCDRNPNFQRLDNRPQHQRQQRPNQLRQNTLQQQPTQRHHQTQSLSELYLNVLKRMQELNSFLQTPAHQRDNRFHNSLLNTPYGPNLWQQNSLGALYSFYKQRKMQLANVQRNSDVINIDCEDSDDVSVTLPNQQRTDDPFTVSLDSSSDSDDCVIEELDNEVINLDTYDSDYKEPQPSTSGCRKPSPKYVEMKKIYGCWLPPDNDFGSPCITSKGCVFDVSLEERSKLLRIFMRQDKGYSKWSELKDSFAKALKDVPSESSKVEESDQVEITSIALGCVKPLRVMKGVPCSNSDLVELSIVKESSSVENEEWALSRIVFNVYQMSDVNFRKNEMPPDFRVFSLDLDEDLVSIPDDLLVDSDVAVLQAKVGSSSFAYFNTRGDLLTLREFDGDSDEYD